MVTHYRAFRALFCFSILLFPTCIPRSLFVGCKCITASFCLQCSFGPCIGIQIRQTYHISNKTLNKPARLCTAHHSAFSLVGGKEISSNKRCIDTPSFFYANHIFSGVCGQCSMATGFVGNNPHLELKIAAYLNHWG